MRSKGDLLLCESAVEQPGNDRKVAALVIGWQNNGVLVLGNWGHLGEIGKGVNELKSLAGKGVCNVERNVDEAEMRGVFSTSLAD